MTFLLKASHDNAKVNKSSTSDKCYENHVVCILTTTPLSSFYFKHHFCFFLFFFVHDYFCWRLFVFSHNMAKFAFSHRLQIDTKKFMCMKIHVFFIENTLSDNRKFIMQTSLWRILWNFFNRIMTHIHYPALFLWY